MTLLHLHFGVLVPVGPVVEVDSQSAAVHTFLYLILPMMDQGSGADDQCPMGDKVSGVLRGGENQYLVTLIK